MYISMVSLSIDGDLMCTVDVKLPEEGLGGLVTLKFWNHGSRAGHYFLSTVIYEPHRLVHVYKAAERYNTKMKVLFVLTFTFNLSYSDDGVSSVAFRPGRNMAVSSSFGGNFKVCMAVVFERMHCFLNS
jgi:NET1-associated nuclear protein 1 (U3 small nucleolar RNA-associated protein 17)